MKTTLALLSSLLVLGSSAHATLLFEEGFNYPVGNLGANSPPWSSGNNNIQVAGANLTFAGLAEAANPGNDMTVTSGVSAGSIAANFASSSVTSGSIYYAFLAKCTTLPTGNNYLTSLLAAGASGPNGGSDPLSVYVGQSVAGSSFKLGVRHNGIGSGATYFTDDADFVPNNVNLFVVKYTFGPNTADDAVSLFVNPPPGGSEPTAAVTVSGGGTDAANLQVVGFKAQSSAAAGNWTFDTLRIGDTWADVVPIAVPEPACSLLALLGVSALVARRRFSR
jgi:hypothetical protein